MLDQEVVFIADRVNNYDNATISNRNLEMLTDTYYNTVISALNNIAPVVAIYVSPKEFLNKIQKHKNSIVLSLWSGTGLRYRRALVPSICEAYGIKYVGADPYVQTICADKHISKSLCLSANFSTPKDVVLSSQYDLPLLDTLHFPAVIKPNFEGGSIGIFRENLVNDYKEAKQICLRLLSEFNQILAEEYICGEEISICIAGTQGKTSVCQAVRHVINGKTFFDREILGAEMKKINQHEHTRDIITGRFPTDEIEKAISLFNLLGKVEMMRIDGRLNNNKFSVIELTPDCSLSSTSSMYFAFSTEGYSYDEMIEMLCKNASIHQEEEC